MSAHHYLKAATRAAHDRVDALYSRFDLSQRDDYTAFLTAQAAAYLPVEGALTAAGIGALLPDWTVHARGASLRADLTDLGIDPPPPLAVPELATPAAQMGAAYVLEGSRLGGAMLYRSVPVGLPARFLKPVSGSGHWRDFLTRLERSVHSDVQRAQAVDGAAQIFDLFARAAIAPVGRL